MDFDQPKDNWHHFGLPDPLRAISIRPLKPGELCPLVSTVVQDAGGTILRGFIYLVSRR